jgi:hypothetical protein
MIGRSFHVLSLLLPSLPLLNPRPNRPLLNPCGPIARRGGRILNPLLLLPPLFQKRVFLLLLIRRFVFAPIIIRILINNKPVRNPANKEPPKQIHSLQTRQQRKANVLRDPAFILLRLPVEFEGPDGGEIGEDRVQDLEVEVVARVAPDAHKEEEVGAGYAGVDVV